MRRYSMSHNLCPWRNLVEQVYEFGAELIVGPNGSYPGQISYKGSQYMLTNFDDESAFRATVWLEATRMLIEKEHHERSQSKPV